MAASSQYAADEEGLPSGWGTKVYDAAMEAPSKEPRSTGPLYVQPGELVALLLQSLLLAASLGFMVATLLGRFTPLPRPFAVGLGLEAGLLVSYTTMRLVARSSGSSLGFLQWLAITTIPTGLGMVLVAVL